MEAAADPVAFSAACREALDWSPSMNAGLGGSKVSEHCLVLEHLLESAPSLRAVFYGFYDDLPTAPVPSELRELGGNRALVFLYPKRAAELLYPSDAFARWRLQLVARVPVVAERLAIWVKVERVRRRLAAIGLTSEENNPFGRAADFAAVEPADVPSFELALSVAANERRPFNFPLQQIMQQCRQRGVKFYFIAMPVPSRHRNLFYANSAWRDYREHVRSLTADGGGTFIDSSDWVPDENFYDPLHADAKGAAIFSRRLADELCSQSAVPPKVEPARSGPLTDTALPFWSEKAPQIFRAKFETSKGSFVIETHRDWAPRGVDRFFNLVRAGFFDDSRFFRVRAGFIAQFGIAGAPEVADRWMNEKIGDDPVRQSNARGFVSYAMTGPDARTTQLFVSLADNSRLDQEGFAPIGRVIEGMEVVDALNSDYGEESGGGMRGGKQGRLFAEGNAYLDREFPKLDRILKASVLPEKQ